MQHYTIAELTKLLRISDESLIAHIKAGRLRATNVGSGNLKPRYRVSQADLDEFLKARSTSPYVAARERRRKQQPVPQYV